MGLKVYKPTSPARRYYSGSDFKEITKGKRPEKLPEVVGDAGLLVPRGDVSGLAENLRAVLEDARLWAELSRAGRARARAMFDYVRQTDAVFDLFEEVARDSRS